MSSSGQAATKTIFRIFDPVNWGNFEWRFGTWATADQPQPTAIKATASTVACVRGEPIALAETGLAKKRDRRSSTGVAIELIGKDIESLPGSSRLQFANGGGRSARYRLQPS